MGPGSGRVEREEASAPGGERRKRSCAWQAESSARGTVAFGAFGWIIFLLLWCARALESTFTSSSLVTLLRDPEPRFPLVHCQRLSVIICH